MARFDRFLLLTCFAILIAITAWLTFHFDDQIDNLEDRQCEFAAIDVGMSTALLSYIPKDQTSPVSRVAVEKAIAGLRRECHLSGG